MVTPIKEHIDAHVQEMTDLISATLNVSEEEASKYFLDENVYRIDERTPNKKTDFSTRHRQLIIYGEKKGYRVINERELDHFLKKKSLGFTHWTFVPNIYLKGTPT